MYNREIKEQFLGECDPIKKGFRPLFEAMDPCESFYGKDLAEMTVSEFTESSRVLSTGTYKTAADVLLRVKTYVKWCDENTDLVINQKLLDLKVDDVDVTQYLSKTIFRSEDELICEMKSVRPFDDGYYDIIVMVFSWLGIPQKYVTDVKISDVDLEKKLIRFNGAEIPFSDNIMDILALYARTKIGTRVNANGQRVVYRDDSYDTFIRRFSPPKQLGKKITNSQIEDAVYLLNKAYMETGGSPRFTAGNVLASGALNRLYDLEQNGVDVFSIKNKDIVADTYRAKAKLYEILWLYKNYKKAFSL